MSFELNNLNFKRIAIVGVGLIGGSFALALKRKGVGEQIIGGMAFNLADRGLLKRFNPYIGFGGGYGAAMVRFNIDTNDPDISADDGFMYVHAGGMEIKIADQFSIFIEEKYIWGTLKVNRDKSISSYYQHEETEIIYTEEDLSFNKQTLNLNQILIKTGIRFYWGQDMFWMYPFFWEK